jgi:hypothetical protein
MALLIFFMRATTLTIQDFLYVSARGPGPDRCRKYHCIAIQKVDGPMAVKPVSPCVKGLASQV